MLEKSKSDSLKVFDYAYWQCQIRMVMTAGKEMSHITHLRRLGNREAGVLVMCKCHAHR